MMITDYWNLVSFDTVNSFHQEIPTAKAFFFATFANEIQTGQLSNTVIQRCLLEIYQNGSFQDRLLGQRCLLCFISCQIEKYCLKLAKDFGSIHGFTHHDLLPYVLNDDGSFPPLIQHHCFAREILESFNVDKSNLTNWTNLKARQHKPLNQSLLQFGLYLISDWAILNDAKTEQLQTILGSCYVLSSLEIQQAQALLEAYHNVYRADRFRRRLELQKQSLGICEVPSESQLRKIADILVSQSVYNYVSTESVLSKLQSLATRLREYRIYIKGGKSPFDSLDAKLENNLTSIEQLHTYDTSNVLSDIDETDDFLREYRPIMLKCLDNALNTVINARFQYLCRKNADKAQTYLRGLDLFYCQRLPMGVIAQKLGLRAQYEVTRLLQLKDLRENVVTEMMINLQEPVIRLARQYQSVSNLDTLEERVNLAISEQIANIIYSSEIEATNVKINQISIFSESVCRQIATIGK